MIGARNYEPIKQNLNIDEKLREQFINLLMINYSGKEQTISEKCQMMTNQIHEETQGQKFESKEILHIEEEEKPSESKARKIEIEIVEGKVENMKNGSEEYNPAIMIG